VTSDLIKNPELYMMAGPNGAGKTTMAEIILPEFLQLYEFVNADSIAAGLSPFNPEGQSIEAGKLMLQRIDRFLERQESFGFETTLASRSFVSTLKKAGELGYNRTLFFLFLPDAQNAIDRVSLRVQQGGHNIPEQDIKRRYKRGLHNLFHLYQPHFDTIKIYHALNISVEPELIALRKKSEEWVVKNTSLWKQIKEKADER
jgi:predicted ABC-type ATPase